MLGHLGINVPDLAAAKAYYDQLMPSFGFEQFFSKSDDIAYLPADGKRGTCLFFYPSAIEGDFSPHRTGLQHIAFMVKTRAEVEATYRLAEQLGSELISKPQEFPQYPPPYYAAFWLDPFGIKIEVVCHHDR